MSTTRTMTKRIELRPFTRDDWYVWPGAEAFPQDVAPLIWEGELEELFAPDPHLTDSSLTIIVDRNGVTIYRISHGGMGMGEYACDTGGLDVDTPDFGRALVTGIVALALEERLRIEDLVRFGFRKS